MVLRSTAAEIAKKQHVGLMNECIVRCTRTQLIKAAVHLVDQVVHPDLGWHIDWEEDELAITPETMAREADNDRVCVWREGVQVCVESQLEVCCLRICNNGMAYVVNACEPLRQQFGILDRGMQCCRPGVPIWVSARIVSIVGSAKEVPLWRIDIIELLIVGAAGAHRASFGGWCLLLIGAVTPTASIRVACRNSVECWSALDML
mmetsp:Transcript_88876/g.190801  ORF Transcript_88876/g.190801 Transcript_88876/m.190801 type:complete len:205 (+) Transcript_88876:756-1370(+)